MGRVLLKVLLFEKAAVTTIYTPSLEYIASLYPASFNGGGPLSLAVSCQQGIIIIGLEPIGTICGI